MKIYSKLFFTLLGTLMSTLIVFFLTKSFVLSYDSWVYWEGSISLLNGDGYREFSGKDIVAWPPLFSIVLSLWQNYFGVSLGSIKLLFVLLAGLNFIVFFYVCIKRFDNRYILLLLFIVIIGFQQAIYSKFLAEGMSIVLCGLLTYLLLCNYRGRYFNIGLMLTGTALLLCKNASIAFFPAVMIFLYVRNNFRIDRDLLMSITALVGGVLIWYLCRVYLNQTSSHSLNFNMYQILQTFVETLSFLSKLLFPSKLQINVLGSILLAILSVRIVIVSMKNGIGNEEIAIVGLIYVYLICIAVAISITSVMIAQRFVIPLIMFIVLLLALAAIRDKKFSLIYLSILVMVAFNYSYRTYFFIGQSINNSMVIDDSFSLSEEWVTKTVKVIDIKIEKYKDANMAIEGKGISYGTYLRWKRQLGVSLEESIY